MIYIEDWFDIYNASHLKAYKTLEKTGMWPIGFIPEDVVMTKDWPLKLVGKFAKGFFNIFEKYTRLLSKKV